jgi:threonine/homoserine/homoserine lactone efflux protein
MTPLFAIGIYWHLPILIVTISLVYSATRYDDWGHILREALRWVVRMTGFLFLAAAALWLVNVFA